MRLSDLATMLIVASWISGTAIVAAAVFGFIR